MELIYAQITLKGFGSYTQPLSQLNVLIDEIVEAALNKEYDSIWEVKLVTMTEEEYNALPEFEGY